MAHVAVAEAALATDLVDRVDLVLSRAALGKDPVPAHVLADRVATLDRLAASVVGLRVTVTDARLVADIAQGYDAVIMGADKWRQVTDSSWYAGEAERDGALRRLPHALVAPRAGDDLDDLVGTEDVTVLAIEDRHRPVSSTAIRSNPAHTANWRADPGPPAPAVRARPRSGSRSSD